MKIIFVMDSLKGGGAERSTGDLWYFLRHHAQIRIVLLEHATEGLEDEILAAGFDLRFLRRRGFVSQSREIARIILDFKPDVVLSVLFRSNMRVRLARVWTRFKAVESLVNFTYDPVRLKDPNINRPAFYVYRFIDSVTSKMVDRFIAVARTVKEHYRDALGIPPEKITVIYRGRNPNEFLGSRAALREELLNRLSLPKDTLLITHAGRQQFQKGHTVLLKAIGMIEKKVDVPIAFLFLGREGSSTPVIREFLRNHPVQSGIFWMGHRHDVPEILAASDIFAFPSFYEGIGGVLIEAMAARLPIVCSNLPGLNEVAIREENALMHEPGDEQQLANHLVALIKDPDLRERMAGQNIERFRKNFQLDAANAQMLMFFQDFVKGESRRN